MIKTKKWLVCTLPGDSSLSLYSMIRAANNYPSILLANWCMTRPGRKVNAPVNTKASQNSDVIARLWRRISPRRAACTANRRILNPPSPLSPFRFRRVLPPASPPAQKRPPPISSIRVCKRVRVSDPAPNVPSIAQLQHRRRIAQRIKRATSLPPFFYFVRFLPCNIIIIPQKTMTAIPSHSCESGMSP